MGWDPNQNLNSLSPCGLKAAGGLAAHVDASAGTEMPAGLLSMQPLNASPHGPLRDLHSLPPEVKRQLHHVAPNGRK
jgi:hypothetical protein